MKIVIPARKGSKGFVNKNEYLFDHTVEQIKQAKLSCEVLVSSDHPGILAKAHELGFTPMLRERYEDDQVSVKQVLEDVVKKRELPWNEVVLLLYLTYPGRTAEHIQYAFSKFAGNSLLCKYAVTDHPYLMLNDDDRPLVSHDLYRRQDYPWFSMISHYICMFQVSELEHLSSNLYNDRTKYLYLSSKPLDVDLKTDYEEFLKNGQNALYIM